MKFNNWQCSDVCIASNEITIWIPTIQRWRNLKIISAVVFIGLATNEILIQLLFMQRWWNSIFFRLVVFVLPVARWHKSNCSDSALLEINNWHRFSAKTCTTCRIISCFLQSGGLVEVGCVVRKKGWSMHYTLELKGTVPIFICLAMVAVLVIVCSCHTMPTEITTNAF